MFGFGLGSHPEPVFSLKLLLLHPGRSQGAKGARVARVVGKEPGAGEEALWNKQVASGEIPSLGDASFERSQL